MTSNGLAATNGDQALPENGRVAVHTFDENATPEQKAASAGKARDQLKSVAQKEEEKSSERGISHIF